MKSIQRKTVFAVVVICGMLVFLALYATTFSSKYPVPPADLRALANSIPSGLTEQEIDSLVIPGLLKRVSDERIVYTMKPNPSLLDFGFYLDLKIVVVLDDEGKSVNAYFAD